jgi:hypothetical protein
MSELQGKYNLELNIVGDGRVFLNFWDWAHGNDVVAEIENGKLVIENKEITFAQYIELVKESILKRTV